MLLRFIHVLLLALALPAAICIAADKVDAPAAPEAALGPALSWRLDAISSSLLGPNRPLSEWRRSAALLDAAARLNPAEPRFPRLEVLAMQHLGDTEGAISAVRSYRKLVPADRQAQVQLIDMYAAKMETVDAKLGYLRGLLDKEDIAPEVRSHIASQCVALLLQKSQPQAAEMAKRAVDLYPLPQAVHQYYELVGRELPLPQRVHALLQVLKASPDDIGYLNEMGTVLATNGMAEQSIEYYGTALSVIIRSGPNRPPGFHNLLIDYASAEIIAGHASAADTFLGQMLDELPLDPDAWFLKLTVLKSAPPQPTNAQILEVAKNALATRWNSIHDDIINGTAASQPSGAASQPSALSSPTGSGGQKSAETKPATTLPAKVDPLDPAAVVAKLKDSNNPDGKNAAVGALSDLAWFELYYDNQPAAAKPWIDAIAAIGGDAPINSRLAGWQALQTGQFQQARDILSKIADSDPLAALGLILADQGEKKPADTDAVQKLLTDHRTGLLGAILWEALQTVKISPTTKPAASEITSDLAKFPKDWLSLSDPRATRRVYDVRVDPIVTSAPIGDPMLFTVTIQNNSDNDIAIGDDALLRPDLWFDAQTLGLERKSFRGVAYDRIGGELVLRPGATVTQTIRLDVGELRAALANFPGMSTRVGGNVITNPVIASAGALPGPAGASFAFDRTAVQAGLPIGTAAGKKQLDAALASESPVDRLHAADFIAACAGLARHEGAPDDLKKLAKDLTNGLVTLRSDKSPLVSGWASYQMAKIGPDDQTTAIATEMSKSDDWTSRLLSLFVDSKNQKELAAALSNDADPSVKAAALAITEPLETPATQPQTQPTSMPATVPAQ